MNKIQLSLSGTCVETFVDICVLVIKIHYLDFNQEINLGFYSYELNLSGDDKPQSQSVLQVEEKLQKIEQKDIQT